MFINDLFENDDFAPSKRVSRQIEQDRHPLSEYLTFEDYDMLMDEFADAQSAVKTDAELDAYLEHFESGLRNTAIPQVMLELVEEFVHGRHGKYGTEVPRRNELLLSDLNMAFSRIWMDFKPDRFVKTLVRHMSQACVAAIHAEESDDMYEDNDMFADGLKRKVMQAVNKELDQMHEYAETHADNPYFPDAIEKINRWLPKLQTNFNSALTDLLRYQHSSSGRWCSSILDSLEDLGVTRRDLSDRICRKPVQENDDDLFSPKRRGKYFGSNRIDMYWDALVPASGHCNTVEGELLRAANKIYYDYFNNGFGNNWSGALNFLKTYLHSVRRDLDILTPYATGRTMSDNPQLEEQIELALDRIMDSVLVVIRTANGNYHPNTQDMYSLSDERDWRDDEEEDDDEWEDEEDEDY